MHKRNNCKALLIKTLVSEPILLTGPKLVFCFILKKNVLASLEDLTASHVQYCTMVDYKLAEMLICSNDLNLSSQTHFLGEKKKIWLIVLRSSKFHPFLACTST